MLDALLVGNVYALARGKDDAHNAVSSAEEGGAVKTGTPCSSCASMVFLAWVADVVLACFAGPVVRV